MKINLIFSLFLESGLEGLKWDESSTENLFVE